MKLELLPCPFCGGKAKNFSTHNGTVYGVICEKCQCESPYYEHKNESINYWNSRPDNDLQERNTELERTLQEIVDNPHGAACHNYQRAKAALESVKRE